MFNIFYSSSLFSVRRAAECGQSVRSFGGSEAGGAGAVFDERLRAADDDETDFVLPHFQRVAISGEDTSGVSEDRWITHESDRLTNNLVQQDCIKV